MNKIPTVPVMISLTSNFSLANIINAKHAMA